MDVALVPLDAAGANACCRNWRSLGTTDPRCFSLLNGDGVASCEVLGEAAASVLKR
jgi:hypothetical protein